MSRKFIQITFSVLLLAGLFLGLAIIDGARSSAVAQDDLTAKFEPQVLNELNSGKSDFIVFMTEQADLSAASRLQTKDAKGQYVFDTLVATADRTQAELRAYIKDQAVSFKPFYIVNAILVKGGSLDLAMAIANRPDVGMIYANHEFQLEQPFITKGALNSPTGIEPNISFVKAPDVWAMGITGQGTIMAGNDTGLQWDHPAIINQYRGWDGAVANHNYNWWDATGTYPMVPTDGMGHGTHTTGTMVGDDGGANQIGMAPGAQTIHCKNMTDGGSGDDGTFLECFEWDLAPWDLTGNNPDPAMAPDAINNSWGYWGGNDNVFRTAIQALHAAGILVEVSAGNEGSSCSTLRSPGDYFEVLTTGSVNHFGVFPGTITDFSSRGPSLLDPNDFFPDIMAPGENIRSSVPGSVYEGGWSGTSMAGPHATALVGLMWSACPSLQGQVEQTIAYIQDTAVPLTGQTGICGGDYDTGPNNDWGFGTIDSLAAVQMAIATCSGIGTLEGTVTDATTSAPIEGANVDAEWEGGFSWNDTTDDAGFYSMMVPEGEYNVIASLFGYEPGMAAVTVITDMVTTQDFALVAAESFLVEGTVTDFETGWPLYAEISIAGYPYGSIWTDPVTGYYSINLPEGIEYEFSVQAFATGYLDETRTVGPLTADAVEDFALLVDGDSCSAPGRHPDCFYYENFEGDDGGFTTSGTTTFAWSTPSSGPGEAHSGDYVWATNPAGNYNNNENGYLTSPVIDLSSFGNQSVLLSWWQWLESEGYWDYASVEVSNNGGTTWSVVYGELSGVIDSEWTRHDLVLDPAFSVSNFRVRFHFRSDSSIVYEGWYIDDLCLNPIEPPVQLYSQNFDANNGGFTHTGYGGPDTWAWGVPTSGPGVAHSVPNVWATNLSGNYATDESSYVESPDLDLTAGAGESISVSWWQWLQTESCCDDGSMEVSNDGGASWTTVYFGYGDVDMSWMKHTVSLDDSYAVSNFRLRFHLYSDYSVEYPGYYVDDINIDFVEEAEIPCVADAGGMVVGNVYDDNTDLALVGALVLSDEGAGFVTVATPGDPNVDDGFYSMFGTTGNHDLTASMVGGYVDDVETVTFLEGATVSQDFFLAAGMLGVSPDSLHVTLDYGDSTDELLTLDNLGGATLSFEIAEKDRGFTPALREGLALQITPREPLAGFDPNASSTKGILSDESTPVTGFLGAGDVLTQWPATAQSFSWGVGYDAANDFVWVGDGWGDMHIYAYTPDGTYTGVNFLADWGPINGPADDTYNSNTGMIWTLDVGSDNCIHEMDPDTGYTGNTVCGPWGISQRGVAYDPATDTFYVGGWNEGVVYHIDSAGTLIESWSLYLSISGLAYNFEAGLLFIIENTSSDTVTVFDVVSGSIVGTFTIPGFGNYSGAGMEIDCDGNLWTVNQGTNTVYLVDSGVPSSLCAFDVPWLSESPISGTIQTAGNASIDVSFDASVVNQPGDYFADLKVKTDSPYGDASVPVTMTVLAPATWGKLDGTVTDLCVTDPVLPLEGVLVAIDGGDPITQTLTDEFGYYWAWIEQGSFDVTYSASGYITKTIDVEVVAGETTTMDVQLVPDKPCITVEPMTVEAWVLSNTEVFTTDGFTIGNIGAQELTWEISEKEGGYSPAGTTRNTVPPEPLAPVENPGSSSLVGMNSTGGVPPAYLPDAWFNAAPIPGAGVVRYGHAQCAEDINTFYVISGVEDGSVVNSNLQYNAETNSWATLSPIPVGAEGVTAVCYDGMIYVVGGAPTGTPTGDLYIYDTTSNTWAQGTSLPRVAWGGAMGAHDGKVYFIGGDPDFFGGGTSNEVNIYDIATDTWTGTGTPMPTPRSTPGYFQLGEFLYVVGGWGDGSPGSNSTATERYDMSSDTWEVGPVFTIAKGDYALAGTSQNLYAIAGDANGGSWFDANPNVWVYDWTQWPGGAWADLADPIATGVTANNGGFATDAVSGGEIWTVAGIDITFTWRNYNVYRPSEPPYSPIPTNVPWVWEVPISGTVEVDSEQAVGVYLTAMSDTVPLPMGTYTATLRIRNNDPVEGAQLVTVIMHIVEEYLAPTPIYSYATPVIVNETVTFNNETVDFGIPPVLREYTWDFGDGTPPVVVYNADPVSHVFTSYDTFTVTLTACNIYDLCADISHEVEVQAIKFFLPMVTK